jgi:hypothetical protein
MRFSTAALPGFAASLLGSAVVSVAVLLAIPTAPAFAVLIATGSGTGNTTAPNPDPGFSRVGVVNGLSAVYFRNGWVLTANHVGASTFWLAGTGHAAVPGSTVRFSNSDSTLADLIAFKLATRPALADVALTNTPARAYTLLTVIGRGLDRGTETSWMGISGWNWAASRAMRWGTNEISSVDKIALDTHAFEIAFDDIPNPPTGRHEADVVSGDSGGGAFSGTGPSAELVGIIFAHKTYVGQPANTSLHGNIGLIVDLYAYRDDILAIVDRPDCNDGLDEDGDGLTDFPVDLGCASASDASERSSSYVCDNGIDDDGDGLIDHPGDPGCESGTDTSERGAVYQCDNGTDDDGDAAVDFPSDGGCLHPTNKIEAPEPRIGLSLGAGLLTLAATARAAGRRRDLHANAQTSSTRSTR